MPSKKNSFILVLYTFSLFLLMCTIGELSFTWHIPKLLVYAFAIVCSIGMTSKLKYKSDNLKLTIIYILFVLYQLFFCSIDLNILSLILNIVQILIIGSLILLPIGLKEKIFSWLSTLFAILIGISIIGWILYLLGVPIPKGELYESDDEFHVLRNYYFFIKSEGSIENVFVLLPRFSGMFMEPGQLAVPCAFFLFGSTSGMKDIRNIIFLIAIILTFSLSGISLIVIGFFLIYIYPWIKRSFARILLFVVLILGTVLGAIQIAVEEDNTNPLYVYVVSRLLIDAEGGLSGDNRTSSYFDSKYEKFLLSNDLYTGLAGKDPRLIKWTYNCSGYKKFIVFYGLIGLLLWALFCIEIYKINKNYKTFSFLIIAIVAFLPRAMLHTFMWLIPFILGMYVLKQNGEFHEQKLSNQYKLTN